MTPPLLFSLSGSELACDRLAVELSAERGHAHARHFPDGETCLRVETDPAGRDTIIVGTLSRPDDKMLPLLFLADALRDCGARRVGFVAPYLAYMRQDTRFAPGEAVTSRSFARFLSRTVDSLLTVEPHLHRFHDLAEIYSIPAAVAHATRDIGAWIATHVRDPLIIGPDAESKQWIDGIAAVIGAPSTVLSKIRRGDTDVVESIPQLSAHRDCTPVLVDDIISTGRTMLVAIEHLKEAGVRAPVCVGVHAVFADGAYDLLQRSGAERIVTTTTIPHASNAIDIIPTIAAALRESGASTSNRS